ncbi:transcriptional regulator [Thiotrichales bacterium HSG14]|nr:transcriptional regulator [Thiotrichales bacterium HSG14]
MDEQKLFDLLSQLCASSENEVVEFKEAKNQYDFSKLGKYFSALSNEANLLNQNEAWLMVALKYFDKSKASTPYRLQPGNLQRLKSEIAAQTNGLTFRKSYELNYPDEKGRGKKKVYLFNIPPAPRGIPIAWKGSYYKRNGEFLETLSRDELKRIRSQLTNDWSANICEGATVNDLSSEAILRARNLYRKKNPTLSHEINQWDDITFLNKVKLTIEGKITRAAIILLGKSESEHFISPSIAKIAWILKDKDNVKKDFQHFNCPFILSIDEICAKIRNLKYRNMNDSLGSFFPEEVEQYDPYVIREALHNCIAHQDYTLADQINVHEKEDGELIFINVGSFIPKDILNVIESDVPQKMPKNPFLAQAMATLNMTNTNIGGGIKRIFTLQREKLFPMPDYNFEDNLVLMKITGKILDLEYTKVLAQLPFLSLSEIILLDKVQKQEPLSSEELKLLRQRKLIEGENTRLYISPRAIDDDECKKMIVDYLKKFGKGNLSDFEKTLFDKLPDILTKTQKKNKIKKNLQALRKEGHLISDKRKFWLLSKTSSLLDET